MTLRKDFPLIINLHVLFIHSFVKHLNDGICITKNIAPDLSSEIYIS